MKAKKTLNVDELVVEYIDSIGGSEEIVDCVRSEVYDDFIEFCDLWGYEHITSALFVRHVNKLYGTSVKLISLKGIMTYIFV